MQFEPLPDGGPPPNGSVLQELISFISRGSTKLLKLTNAKSEDAMSKVYEVLNSPTVKSFTYKTNEGLQQIASHSETAAYRVAELLLTGAIVACDGTTVGAKAVCKIADDHPYIAIVTVAGAVAGILYMMGAIPVLIQFNNALCATLMQTWQMAVASAGEMGSYLTAKSFRLLTYVPINVRVSIATLVKDVFASTIALCNSTGAVVYESTMLFCSNANSCCIWLGAQVNEMAAVVLGCFPAPMASRILQLLASAHAQIAAGHQFVIQAGVQAGQAIQAIPLVQYAIQNPVQFGLMSVQMLAVGPVAQYKSKEWLSKGPSYRNYLKSNRSDIAARREKRADEWNTSISKLRARGKEPGSDPIVEPGSDPIVAPGSDPIVAPGSDPIVAPGSDPIVAPGSDPIVAPGSDPIVAPGPDAIFAPGPEYSCPIAMDYCFEPVAVHSANGIIQYYEREELEIWCEDCIRKNLEPFVPHTKEPYHYETPADLVVDEDARRILYDFRMANGLPTVP
jgi:hypothetical protein